MVRFRLLVRSWPAAGMVTDHRGRNPLELSNKICISSQVRRICAGATGRYSSPMRTGATVQGRGACNEIPGMVSHVRAHANGEPVDAAGNIVPVSCMVPGCWRTWKMGFRSGNREKGGKIWPIVSGIEEKARFSEKAWWPSRQFTLGTACSSMRCRPSMRSFMK